MNLFANKLGKLRLFEFFDYSFSKKEKISLIFIRQHSPTHPPPFLQKQKRGLGMPNFLKLKNIKSHKSCGHQPSLNESSDKKTLGIGNFAFHVLYFMKLKTSIGQGAVSFDIPTYWYMIQIN